ncbi:hypothetical protein [Amycolatopsis suaedae]|uniref:SCO6045-like C-terminal domain-containing protein n=1 Tax=Amycolatopsis suaedae TaxID=2510978 RepID=A0A4Q7J339_9PSEU|nr:hypothetical protein [Amycolatopsis suaedae]RZQ61369.1 hypothetical protein EWH70_23535 [Amycolatopsis suaedae]
MTGRERLAREQAGLLRALLAGGPAPAGFDPGRLATEARSLRAKRRRVTALLRPDVAHYLGERFTPLFHRWAADHPKAAGTRARQDAEDFVAWLLETGELPRPRRSLLSRVFRAG